VRWRGEAPCSEVQDPITEWSNDETQQASLTLSFKGVDYGEKR